VRYAEKHGTEVASKLTVFTKYVTDNPSKANAEKVNEASRNKLGVSSLDLVQFHWWDFESSASFVNAAKELVALQNAGKIKHVGVTNFDVQHLSSLIDAHVEVKVNQVQYSLFDRRPEHGMLAYCQANDCQLIAYGTVAGGWLSDRYLGKQQQEVHAAQASQRMYESSLQMWSGGDWGLYQELLQQLRKIGDKHGGVSIANVATRYVIQMLESTCGGGVIKGIRDTTHLEDLASLQSFSLDDEDFAQIKLVLGKGNDLPGDCYGRERGYTS
jgi:aryl-alcohol dehydrogenase-like predicted oxidoreductase